MYGLKTITITILVSVDIYNNISSTFYGDRISKDMDHLEVVLKIGNQKHAKKESIYIRNDILDRAEINEIGLLGFLDCMLIHKTERNDFLQQVLGQLQALYIRKCNLRVEKELNGSNNDIEDELLELDAEWQRVSRRIGDLNDLHEHLLQCSATTFYEILLNEYRNRVIALQGSLDALKTYKC